MMYTLSPEYFFLILHSCFCNKHWNHQKPSLLGLSTLFCRERHEYHLYSSDLHLITSSKCTKNNSPSPLYSLHRRHHKQRPFTWIILPCQRRTPWAWHWDEAQIRTAWISDRTFHQSVWMPLYFPYCRNNWEPRRRWWSCPHARPGIPRPWPHDS